MTKKILLDTLREGNPMLKILIAEDDRELRQLFTHVLAKNGYVVKGVGDGQEAMDALDKDYYDRLPK